MCGNPQLDFDALQRNAKYEGGFAAARAWCAIVLSGRYGDVRDAQGIRLAKRTGGLSLRDLRASGKSPGDVLKMALK